MKFIGYAPSRDDLPDHRSAVSQNSIKSDLLQFKNSNIERPADPCLDLAVAIAFLAFKLPEEQKPIHLNDVFLQDLDIWNKSPGLPWKNLGYRSKDDIRKDPEAVRKVRLFWHRIKVGDDLSPPDCLAYVPSHVCPVGENKTSLVMLKQAIWEYPATMTFGEAVFAVPLIRKYQKHGPIAYGYETAVGGMKKIKDRFGHYKYFSRIYFKKFDKTVPVWLIRISFKILLYNADFVHYEDYGIADARRLMRMWDYLVEYFINTKIRTANGLRFKKNVGIALGSYFTQLVGSICNYILITWAYLSQFGHEPADMLVLGEDSIAGGHECLKLDEAQKLFDKVGMNINFEKSQITTNLLTLKFPEHAIENAVDETNG